MWGFGIYLMHLADWLTRRKYDKEKRRSREDKQEQLADRKQCRICRKNFGSEIELENHIKENHPNNTI
ncbi:MAG TPA: hypothetical protein VIP70_01430 [Nitrososphaeraceae archaeon]|jgi:hypothetical protein